MAKQKLDYSRVTNSPYPAGSAEDRKLSADQSAFAKRNRANLAQGVKDVVTGRAAVEGAKVVGKGIVKAAKSAYKGTIGNALQVEQNHAKINGFNQSEKSFNNFQRRRK